MDFTGKVVIITGSSSGIGAATAKLFATYGAFVTIVGRNHERLAEVSEACTTARGNKPISLLLDLTQNNSCETLVQNTVQVHGRIDVLVNCAGKLAVTSLFDNIIEDFDDLMALNLRVPYKLTQLCIPYLKESKGNIVNVISAPLRPSSFLCCSMIRDAMERFTKSGALELASVGIRMNAVRPGITRTNLLTNLNFERDVLKETYEHLAKMVPTKTVIEPEEIARMIAFAASDMCPNMTAANLLIDGALSQS